jgi:hypothetical protein
MNENPPTAFESFAGLPVPTICAADAGWQMRFLDSPLLRRLAPLHWQQLLQGLAPMAYAAGTPVIEAGTSGTDCYVLQAGFAQVHVGARCLARLEPGALFGEDALITGGLRNASVSMLTDGRVGRLPAERFERWLLRAVICPLASVGGRRTLCIDGVLPQDRRYLHLPLARIRDPAVAPPRAAAYCVVGGQLRERWLAAFVLAQQGYDALPLDAGDDFL